MPITLVTILTLFLMEKTPKNIRLCVYNIFIVLIVLFTPKSPLLCWLDIAYQRPNDSCLAWSANSPTYSCLCRILVVLYKYNVFLCALYVPYGCKFPGHTRFKIEHGSVNPLLMFREITRPNTTTFSKNYWLRQVKWSKRVC